jgi:hypothetical protein
VPDEFPVEKVIGSKDWSSWRVVHVGCREIIRPIWTEEDIIVGEVLINDRIGKAPGWLLS